MNELKKNKNIILVCIILVLVATLLLIMPKKEEDIIPSVINNEEIKKYEANTFIPVYIKDNDIANKYLNDYKNLLLTDLEESYNLLNINYRNEKFRSFEEFKDYINERKSVMFYNMRVKEYSIFNRSGYKFYYIKTTNEDTFIFKELSIMNYEVYLDNYSVEFK